MARYKSNKRYSDKCLYEYEYNVSPLDDHRPFSFNGQQGRRTSQDLIPEHSSISMSSYHKDVRTDSDSRLTFYCNRPPSKISYRRAGANSIFSQENKNTYFNQKGRDSTFFSREELCAPQKRKRLTRRSSSFSDDDMRAIPVNRRQESPFYSEDELFHLDHNTRQDSSSFSKDNVFSPPYNKKLSSPSFSFKNVCSSHIPISQAIPSFSTDFIDGSPFYGIVRDKEHIIPQSSSSVSIGDDEHASETSLNSDFNMFDGNHNHGETGGGEPMVDQLILVEGQEVPDPSNEDMQCILKTEDTNIKQADASVHTVEPSLDSGDAKVTNIVNDMKPNKKVTSDDNIHKLGSRRIPRKRRNKRYYAHSTSSESSEAMDSKKPKKRIYISNTTSAQRDLTNASDSTKSQSDKDGRAKRSIQLNKPNGNPKADRKRRSKLTTSRSYQKHVSSGTKYNTSSPPKGVDMSENCFFQSYQFYILVVSIPIAWLAVKMIATFNNADFIIEPLFWFGDMRARVAPKGQCSTGQSHAYLPRESVMSETDDYIPEEYIDRTTGPDQTSTQHVSSTHLSAEQDQIHVESSKDITEKQPRLPGNMVSSQDNVAGDIKQTNKSHGNEHDDGKVLSEHESKSNEKVLKDLSNLELRSLMDTQVEKTDTEDTTNEVPTAYPFPENPQTERVYDKIDPSSDLKTYDGANGNRIKYEDQRFHQKASQKVTAAKQRAYHVDHIKHEELDPTENLKVTGYTRGNTGLNIDDNTSAGESIPKDADTSTHSIPTRQHVQHQAIHREKDETQTNDITQEYVHKQMGLETESKHPDKTPILYNAAEPKEIPDMSHLASSEAAARASSAEDDAAGVDEAHHKKCRWGPSFFFKSCLF